MFLCLSFYSGEVQHIGYIRDRIVFCYSIYPGRDANEIRQEKVKAFFNLVNYYEDQITNNSGRCVLINWLRFSNKLILREINNITEEDPSEDFYHTWREIADALEGNNET